MALPKRELHTLAHMLEQIDGLELRLNHQANPNFEHARATFASDAEGIAAKLEHAVDLLTRHPSTTPPPTQQEHGLETLVKRYLDTFIVEVKDERHHVDKAKRVLESMRMELLKMQMGLQCLRVDVMGVGGYDLRKVVGRENERQARLVEVRMDSGVDDVCAGAQWRRVGGDVSRRRSAPELRS